MEHHVFPLGSDDLLLVTRQSRGLPQRLLFVGTDARASNLADEYTRCLDGDPSQIIELEKRIREDYGYSTDFRNFTLVREASGSHWLYDPCGTPDEAQYYEFLQALHDELTRINAIRWPDRRYFLSLRVTQIDQEFQLNYNEFGPIIAEPGPGKGVSFEVSHRELHAPDRIGCSACPGRT